MRHHAVLILTFVASAALAQPHTGPVEVVTVVPTGLLTLEVDGTSIEYQLTATYYPADYGANDPDGPVADTMRRLAGRSLHEATWSKQVMEMMGREFVISENLRVEIAASTAHDEVDDLGVFSMVMPLEPETLALDPSERSSISFWPPGQSGIDYFEASSENSDLAVVIDEAAWQNGWGFTLRGSFTGTATANPGADSVQGSIRLVGSFEVQWVDGGGTEIDVPLDMLMDGEGSE